MNIKKNKNGFTLIELLVAISILGIILIIALPQLSNLQSQNQITKYKKYTETMLTSAKLYTDSYTEDMFGNNTSGCYDIPYSDMKDKDLLKDIKINNSTCNSANTFVRVRKANNHYLYQTSIYCTDKNGKVVYNEILNTENCDGGEDRIGPTIQISPSSKDWTKGTNETVTVKVWDAYGMLENAQVKFTWTKDGNFYSEEIYSYKNKRYAGTEDKKLSHSLKLPQSETGIFVLTVTPINVRDSVGNYQVSTHTSGEYKLDNEVPTAPTINLKKWKDNSTRPTSGTGLTTYTKNTWSNKKIYTYPSESDDHNRAGGIYYKFTTTGATENETNVKQNYRSIEAEGTSNIKWIACDKLGNCSSAVSSGNIKIDKTAPTCSVNFSGTKGNDSWYKSNIDISLTNNDTGSKVYRYGLTTNSNASYNSKTSGTQSDTTETTWYGYVEDEAGNTNKCNKIAYVDTTAPVITSYSQCKGTNLGGSSDKITQTILTIKDAGSGVGYIMRWKIRGVQQENYLYKDGNLQDVEARLYSSQKDYTLSAFEICDKLGNCSNGGYDSIPVTYNNLANCS